jgi:hypothetical protein
VVGWTASRAAKAADASRFSVALVPGDDERRATLLVSETDGVLVIYRLPRA